MSTSAGRRKAALKRWFCAKAPSTNSLEPNSSAPDLAVCTPALSTGPGPMLAPSDSDDMDLSLSSQTPSQGGRQEWDLGQGTSEPQFFHL